MTRFSGSHACRAAGAAVCVLIASAVAGCGSLTITDTGTTAGSAATAQRTTRAPRPLRLQGEPARAAAAVSTFFRALRDGDVEGLCRPGVIFTAAVIADIQSVGDSCEASDEVSSLLRRPPVLTVVGLAFRRDLAIARVRAGERVVPLDVVRDGRRWLVSFSDGVNPLDALDP